MKALLDTQALLWLVSGDWRISEGAKSVYLNPDNQVYLSSASIWEMAIKISLSKLKIPSSLEQFVTNHVRGNGIQILEIQLPHLYVIEHLPLHHRDPFDRLLVAQAMLGNLLMVSADPAFDAYPVTRIW